MIKFVGGFDKVPSLPNTQFPEYAFVGRSNVGKSSLLNAVVNANVARTSNTPGRTQTLNLFNIDDRVMLVDLPGYGYARVSKEDALNWLQRLEEYLMTRRQLRRLFILIDSRIGARDSDLDLMDFCDIHGISYQIVYTKKDKRIREKSQQKISHENHPAMIAEILETSAEKKTGLEPLRTIIGIK
ncbi:MAG TPA: YihA family ribosome biogenesis GTP-binding protein [Candidatus Enterousia avicola]|uniref:Probable GTP-binding protein EngB n=1 Tax=Candidatus Enterousia avicola TaxID=2840787 RepID=A0A9D1MT42_9PROT|nr:YihA family ribosome biogenesis GTP-binding protein [Candidatus Enterousia avicola]